jgi:hypothetical protein
MSFIFEIRLGLCKGQIPCLFVFVICLGLCEGGLDLRREERAKCAEKPNKMRVRGQEENKLCVYRSGEHNGGGGGGERERGGRTTIQILVFVFVNLNMILTFLFF